MPYAVAGADRAELAADFDRAARLLLIAVEMIPRADPQRPGLLARLALALTWKGDRGGIAVRHRRGRRPDRSKTEVPAGELLEAGLAVDSHLCQRRQPGAPPGCVVKGADTPSSFRFDRFEFQAEPLGLRCEGKRRSVQALPLRLLALLLERAGEPVSRDEICAGLWMGRAPADVEHSINTAIKKLRRVLSDSAKQPLWIETVRDGYRFAGRVESGAASDHRTSIERLRHLPLVKRDADDDRLARVLDTTTRRTGSCLLLLGEDGIGKTRLLGALAERARWRGIRVLWGQCVEGGWDPYGPIADAALRLGSDELRRAAGSHARLLASIVPALRDAAESGPDGLRLAPDEERDRIPSAFVETLRQATSFAPLLLVLDDLQWADPSTLDVLSRLFDRLPESAICVAAAAREPSREAHAVLQLLDSLPSDSVCERIHLTGLGRNEVGQLVAAIAGHEVDARFTTALHHETNGNPLFVREVLRSLLEARAIDQEDRSWGSVSLEQLDLPVSVREVVARRLGRLSTAGRRLLDAASVFTASFDFPVASRAGGLDEAMARAALEELVDASLVRGTESDHGYDFCHALVRNAVYRQLSPSRRVRLHRSVAVLLETRERAAAGAIAGEIAEHYLRSAELQGADAGLRHCLGAAAKAEATAGAHAEAARLLGSGLALLSATDPRRARV